MLLLVSLGLSEHAVKHLGCKATLLLSTSSVEVGHPMILLSKVACGVVNVLYMIFMSMLPKSENLTPELGFKDMLMNWWHIPGTEHLHLSCFNHIATLPPTRISRIVAGKKVIALSSPPIVWEAKGRHDDLVALTTTPCKARRQGLRSPNGSIECKNAAFCAARVPPGAERGHTSQPL